MSQSPIEDFSEATVMRYRQGWQALNRLLHEDRSFSGHERHNAYLNCGGSGKFADVSTVTGLDFAEDGRAIGPVDWDFDGDLDLWMTNRTAPRVRFLANQIEAEGSFVSFQLEGNGKGTNRDAIGARVTVHLGTQPLIKSVHAGESFLSQSSQWMHFGLGPHDSPVDVTVDWPGGGEEHFKTLELNQFYVLRQGSGQAERWQKPNGILDLKKGNADLPLPEPEANARIVLADGVALPTLKTPSGEIISLKGQATLVTLWATWCRPCLEELATWSGSADRFRQGGLNVLALNVDEEADGRAKAGEILHKLKVPFRHQFVAPESVRGLDIIQRAALDRWEALPIPCSFLVDAQGLVAAIYKGPVEVDVILADAKQLFGADQATRRDAAIPFPGTWTHDPTTADPLYAASHFVDHNLVPAALDYIRLATELDQRVRPGHFGPTTFADRYYVMATLLREQGLADEAIEAYSHSSQLNPRDLRSRRDLGDLLKSRGRAREAVAQWQAAEAINPRDLDVQQRLAMTHLQLSQAKEALPHLQRLVTARPGDARMRYLLGTALQETGQLTLAIQAFEETTRLNANLLNADNNIAWIRATHPDSTMRDGAEALRLAQAVNAKSGNQNPNLLHTLSAAYAETGQFKLAVQTADRALALLEADKKSPPAKTAAAQKAIQTQRAHYAEGKPFRDPKLAR